LLLIYSFELSHFWLITNALFSLLTPFLGSSVATSLSEAESVKKQVGILYVKGTKFHIRPIPLKTVRPFVFDIVDLATEYRDEPARNMNQGVSYQNFVS